MRASLAVLGLLLAGCSVESRTCRNMEQLCGTPAADCRSHLDAVRQVAGDKGVEAVATCFADAKTCGDATGCSAGAGLKALGGAASDFFEGMKKQLAK